MYVRAVLNLMNILLAAIIVTISNNAAGLTFPIKPESDLIGIVQTAIVQKNETIPDIARKFDIGSVEVMQANPKVKPKQMKAGTVLTIPTSFILPPGPRTGIVLNLAELRIYYYPPGGTTVVTHPVGIGRVGWRTPVGETAVIRKKEKPTWRPPASIRNSYARKGKTLPRSVPPGPKNPLGEYAMYLGWPRYLIHGTNRPKSVGLRSSSGCIRMYPEDIESLFNVVNKGTTVRVIHEPFKVGKFSGKLYLEAHEPFPESYYGDEDDDELFSEALDEVYYRNNKINWPAANSLLKQSVGYPIEISF
jgi:L,D-transpeptidase ErfK/SrfK